MVRACPCVRVCGVCARVWLEGVPEWEAGVTTSSIRRKWLAMRGERLPFQKEKQGITVPDSRDKGGHGGES